MRTKERTRRRQVPTSDLASARETAHQQVRNAVWRELLREHMSALQGARYALFALWNHEGLDPDAVDSHDSRVELMMAIEREQTRAVIAYSRLTDDAYGIIETQRLPDGTFAALRRPRPFDDLECAPEYERGPDEDREDARRRAEALATRRILVERGFSPRAATAALDPVLAAVRSRELPAAPAKAAERASARRRAQLLERRERLQQRLMECEREDNSKFGHIRKAAIPEIAAAIAWLNELIAATEK